MFIPNWVDVYGSNYFRVKNNIIYVNQSRTYSQTINIAKSGLKALDQPSERCDNGAAVPSTSSCIAKYIEKQLGCSINIHGKTNRELQDHKMVDCKV